MNEFVLVKINTDLIKENEENLLELRMALTRLEENISDGQILRSITELKLSIDNELQEKTPQKISEKELENKKHRGQIRVKRSLFAFVGTALK